MTASVADNAGLCRHTRRRLIRRQTSRCSIENPRRDGGVATAVQPLRRHLNISLKTLAILTSVNASEENSEQF
jgi:hypothetical protein